MLALREELGPHPAKHGGLGSLLGKSGAPEERSAKSYGIKRGRGGRQPAQNAASE